MLSFWIILYVAQIELLLSDVHASCLHLSPTTFGGSYLPYRRTLADLCLTAVGAPRALARNYDGYSAIGRSRQGRWSAWERKGMAFDAASAFLQERDDICVPVEFLSDLIQEDRYGRSASLISNNFGCFLPSCLVSTRCTCNHGSGCKALLISDRGDRAPYVTLRRIIYSYMGQQQYAMPSRPSSTCSSLEYFGRPTLGSIPPPQQAKQELSVPRPT